MLDTLVELLDRHGPESGAMGVAVGRKEVDSEVEADGPYVAAFFVRGKEPRAGARLRLRSGRRIIPAHVAGPEGRIRTDVVDVAASTPRSRASRLQVTRFTAGGPVSNRTELGTFGCLVTRKGSQFTYALTNRHVAIGVDEFVFFPSPTAREAIAAVTREAIGLLADEQFCPLVDEPNAYFDVDAALVQIPEAKKSQFSSHIPTLGNPTSIFQPDFRSTSGYLDSVIESPVASWNWNSKRREGVISHAWYTTRRAPGRPIVTYSFLIRPTDGSVASAAMDSGKAWVREQGDVVSLMALHQGSVDPETGARFAVATEMASLARLWSLGIK